MVFGINYGDITQTRVITDDQLTKEIQQELISKIGEKLISFSSEKSKDHLAQIISQIVEKGDPSRKIKMEFLCNWVSSISLNQPEEPLTKKTIASREAAQNPVIQPSTYLGKNRTSKIVQQEIDEECEEFEEFEECEFSVKPIVFNQLCELLNPNQQKIQNLENLQEQSQYGILTHLNNEVINGENNKLIFNTLGNFYNYFFFRPSSQLQMMVLVTSTYDKEEKIFDINEYRINIFQDTNKKVYIQDAVFPTTNIIKHFFQKKKEIFSASFNEEKGWMDLCVFCTHNDLKFVAGKNKKKVEKILKDHFEFLISSKEEKEIPDDRIDKNVSSIVDEIEKHHAFQNFTEEQANEALKGCSSQFYLIRRSSQKQKFVYALSYVDPSKKIIHHRFSVHEQKIYWNGHHYYPLWEKEHPGCWAFLNTFFKVDLIKYSWHRMVTKEFIPKKIVKTSFKQGKINQLIDQTPASFHEKDNFSVKSFLKHQRDLARMIGNPSPPSNKIKDEIEQNEFFLILNEEEIEQRLKDKPKGTFAIIKTKNEVLNDSYKIFYIGSNQHNWLALEVKDIEFTIKEDKIDRQGLPYASLLKNKKLFEKINVDSITYSSDSNQKDEGLLDSLFKEKLILNSLSLINSYNVYEID
jgi:hypothetical protein